MSFLLATKQWYVVGGVVTVVDFSVDFWLSGQNRNPNRPKNHKTATFGCHIYFNSNHFYAAFAIHWVSLTNVMVVHIRNNKIGCFD